MVCSGSDVVDDTLLEWIQSHSSGLQFIAVGHRVVHGCAIFSTPVIVDAGAFAKLEALVR